MFVNNIKTGKCLRRTVHNSQMKCIACLLVLFIGFALAESMDDRITATMGLTLNDASVSKTRAYIKTVYDFIATYDRPSACDPLTLLSIASAADNGDINRIVNKESGMAIIHAGVPDCDACGIEFALFLGADPNKRMSTIGDTALSLSFKLCKTPEVFMALVKYNATIYPWSTFSAFDIGAFLEDILKNKNNDEPTSASS